MDSNAYSQYIYFPTTYDKNWKPQIIYVSEKWNGREWKGSTDPLELDQGRFQYYPIWRCQPYSDALWKKCEAWIKHYENLRERFKKLMTEEDSMPRRWHARKVSIKRVKVDTLKNYGNDIHCNVCGYDGIADVVAISSRRNGQHGMERCPECKSLNLIRRSYVEPEPEWSASEPAVARSKTESEFSHPLGEERFSAEDCSPGGLLSGEGARRNLGHLADL